MSVPRTIRTTISVALALLTAATLWPVAVSAQTPGAEAEWAFAPKGVFGDGRVVQSMVLQMDTDRADAASGLALGYLDLDVDALAPLEDANILLMAAGVVDMDGQVQGFEVARGCLVWSGGEGDDAEALAAAGAVLAEELSAVWAPLGLEFDPCEPADDPAAADLLVFPAGEPPAGVDFAAVDWEASFLASVPPPASDGPGEAGGTGGEGGVMTLEVPDPDEPDYLPGTANRDYFGDEYAVFAGGALCASGEVPAAGGFTVTLGGPGQPAACGTEGNTIEVAGSRNGPFTFTSQVEADATVVLSNWAPYPTETPYPAYVCTWLGPGSAEIHSGCALAATLPQPAPSGNLGPASSEAYGTILLGLLGALGIVAGARRLTARS